jgi:hypothetical protein
MERCLHCNSVLTSKEKVCPNCFTSTRRRGKTVGDTLQWLGRLILYSASAAMLFTWLLPGKFPFEAVLAVFGAAFAVVIRR